MNDPRAAECMRRYMALLNRITALGVEGFAHVLDTSTAAEMSALIMAAEIIQKQIDKTQCPPV